MSILSILKKSYAGIAVGLMLTAGTALATPELTEDGLYATFNVSQGGSSLGNFTARLNYAEVPRTVANFVGLAEGDKTWIDPVTFEAKNSPYYDGIIFHRVISGFMIQGGSPQGTGTDGPGYTFSDEFDPTLRHDAAGILSMANSGPDTNGSQFFVTLGATSWLDDKHSVFGSIVDGLDVVQAVGAVSVDGSDRPLTDVVIDSVVITRVGTAALGFDASAQALPTVEATDLALALDGAGFEATYTQQGNRQYFTSTSTDLINWSSLQSSPLLREVDAAGATALSLEGVFDTATEPKGFLQQAVVHYPDPILSPPDALNKELILNLSADDTVRYAILEPEASVYGDYGTATLNAETPGTLRFYFWRENPYRVDFYAESVGIVPIRASLVFETAASGSFSGEAYPPSSPSFDISGTFTLGDIPPVD
jgi:cyclophilin family peptidyl-prolyl cis-trans isomerase